MLQHAMSGSGITQGLAQLFDSLPLPAVAIQYLLCGIYCVSAVWPFGILGI